ncbi:MAG: hypothetical protein ACK457_02170 [Flavobacteriia bacterium]|jgi:Tfp pilus assembly protein FimV
MTERKRVLCSLLLLALFAAQLVYVCSAFALDPSDKYNTSLSLEEETEEDFPDSTEEEDNESESDYFVTQSEIVVFVQDEETQRHVFRINLLSLLIHLDTAYSPPELML